MHRFNCQVFHMFAFFFDMTLTFSSLQHRGRFKFCFFFFFLGFVNFVYISFCADTRKVNKFGLPAKTTTTTTTAPLSVPIIY